ncbi:MAG TPA: cellulase family glycosylhydrolase [Ktedonobacteraceae bacterium]|nr:cellulase family glycosylhydrolase [Ktedonobacteraceae bacterium]
MPRALKIIMLGIVVVAILAMGVLWLGPMRVIGARNVARQEYSSHTGIPAANEVAERRPSPTVHVAPTQKPTRTVTPVPTPKPSPTVTATGTPSSGSSSREAHALGPYAVKGNLILAADGKPYLFHGVGRDGLEYSCTGDGHFDAQELSYMGSGTNRAGVTYWGANTVRLPLSEGIWLYGQSSHACSAAQYQALVRQVVNALTALKLNVVLDLQWIDAGGQSLQGGGPWAMPDADSITFWQQVAGMYSSYSNVLFELFNEPHPSSWSCWLSSCTLTDKAYSDDCHCTKTLTFASVGMQAVVDAVRNTGAANLVLVAGMDWGFNLSLIATYLINGSNVVYDTHPYPYAEKLLPNWNAAFGTISNTYPVMSAESGEYDCGTGYMSQLLSYFDAHHIGWVAWAWVAQGSPCGYPQLIQNYRGTPVPGMGQLVYTRLHGYV